MSLLSKPFSAELREPKPSAEYLRGCRVEAVRTKRGRFTKVTLPDGRSMTLVGPARKTEAVRNALSHFKKHPEHRWRIVSDAGVDMGVYSGRSRLDALDAMARDAGYASEDDANASGIEPFSGVVTRID
jgi:hypothetical protein